MRKTLPSQVILLDYLTYNKETGELRWARDIPQRLKKHLRKKGDIATAPLSARYVAVSIQGRTYYAHRVIWVMETGIDPGIYEIDHKDRDGFNNAWENLRLGTRSLNCCNTQTRKDNSSGHRGVHRTRSGRWKVQIAIRGLRLGGNHTTLESAIAEANHLLSLREETGAYA